MACHIPACIRTMYIFHKIRRIRHYRIESSVNFPAHLHHVFPANADSLLPRRGLHILFRLLYRLFINIYSHDMSLRTLGRHQRNQSCTCTYIEYPPGIVHLYPRPQKYPVGTHLHRTPVVINRKLLELEIWIRHITYNSYFPSKINKIHCFRTQK